MLKNKFEQNYSKSIHNLIPELKNIQATTNKIILFEVLRKEFKLE
jgi:hypothetical protein